MEGLTGNLAPLSLSQYNAVVTALAATDGVITSGGLGQSVWVGYADHGDLTAHWVAEAYPNRRYGKHTLMS